MVGGIAGEQPKLPAMPFPVEDKPDDSWVTVIFNMSWRVLQSQDKLLLRDPDSDLLLYSSMVRMCAHTFV